MIKFHGMKTCTTNLEVYLPDTYHKITHTTIAEKLATGNYLNEIHCVKQVKILRYPKTYSPLIY